MGITTPKNAGSSGSSFSTAQIGVVREQLARLTSSSLFNQSKRYPALLSFIVEAAIEGRLDELKERTIGVAVFDRPADYDSNLEPVVRVAAGEVRRRLTQYYADPAHQDELHIALPIGSYVPTFSPPESPIIPFEKLVPDPASAKSAGGSQNEQRSVAAIKAPQTIWRTWKAHAAMLLIAAVLVSGFLFYRARFLDSLHSFWKPTLDDPAPVLICIGEYADWLDISASNKPPVPDSSNKPPPAESTTVDDFIHQSLGLDIGDVQAANRVSLELARFGKTSRIMNSSKTTLTDLRAGPVILLGGMSNKWTMRELAKLPFGIDHDANGGWIEDRSHPDNREWGLPYKTLLVNYSRDFGIIARLHDTDTDHPLTIISGMGENGNVAIGELLTNADYMDAFLVNAPKNWKSMNMEAVIMLEVVDGKSGRPHLLAVKYW